MKRGMLGSFLAPFFIFLLVLAGIATAVLAYAHPEYLVTFSLGLGALALLVLIVLLRHGRHIQNPFY